jgi:hypothetical protein
LASSRTGGGEVFKYRLCPPPGAYRKAKDKTLGGWKGKADEEIKFILEKIGENEFIKKTIYNFIKWQDNFSQKEKEDKMKKVFFLALLSSFLFSCTYSQNMINPEGQTVRCSSYGWGIIGGPMAINILNDCVASHKQLGYTEIENIGVAGFFMTEGNPPTFQKVQMGWPAEKAGMLPDDKIISVNGQKPTSMKAAFQFGFCKPGEPVNYQVDRNGEIKSFTIITMPKAKKVE